MGKRMSLLGVTEGFRCPAALARAQNRRNGPAKLRAVEGSSGFPQLIRRLGRGTYASPRAQPYCTHW